MEVQSMEGVDFQELECHEVISRGLLDFDQWTSLISEIEKTYPENIQKISLVYESFLSEFPLCYGYWRKYAYHKIQLCGVDKAIEVFERAVQSATFSVDVWVDYCSFGISAFEDPSDVRRLFKRGMSFVGKDYLSHVLWDKYIEYEFSQQQWSSLALLYIQNLQFPTKKLCQYYESFKKLAAIWEEEMMSPANSTLDAQSEPAPDDENCAFYKLDDVMHAIEDMLNLPSGPTRYKALQKYISFGEKFYQEACQLDENISFFETNIRRSYFHIKPLDVNQLENWHNYLDFIEVQGDFDWAVKLYERCLIPCANYPEFWMRYVEFMESKGGREAANFSLERATQTFVKRVPVIHLFNARYKESIGDFSNARAALLQCDQESDTEFVQNVVIKANMERRQGNFSAASDVYKEALKLAESKDKSHAPILYVHFSRLQHMITDSADAARDVLIEGIKHMPSSKLLLEELIKLSMMNGGSRHINEVDPIIANSLSLRSSTSQSLSTKDAEDVSNLYLEFVDLCGNVQDVMKAWHRHIKLFPNCVRTVSFKHPGASVKPWKLATESRKEILSTLPPQSEDSGHQVQSSFQEEKLSSSGNHISLSDHGATSQIFDQNPHILENHELPFEAGAIDPHQSEESENDVQETVEPVRTKSSKQPIEDDLEPNMLTLESVQVTNDGQIVQSSQEYFEKDSMQQQYDIEPEQDLRPPSLEKLCLDSHRDKSRDLIPKESDECEADVETSFSNGRVMNSESPRVKSKSNESLLEISHDSSGDHFVSSPISTRIADSPKSHSEIFCHSAGSQSTALEAHSLRQMHANSGGNWRQRDNHERNRKDSRYGFHGHSHRRFHQRQQLSPQKQYQQAEMGTRIPVSQNQMSQLLHPQNLEVHHGSQGLIAPTVPAKGASPQAWSVQNVQHQNFATANQSQPLAQPAAFPQAHKVLHATQSSEQHGDLQNNQAYNQMWQYYYYQQQQQFLMQQQPHQQLQLLQQQYQQQQLQMQQQYLQQQQLQQQQLSDEQNTQLQQQQDQQQPLQMQQQQQFQEQQQQWQLQYQQQFLQQQYPYQLQQHQLQQQQHILYLQQQQLQIQQSQQQPSEQHLENHLYHQQQQQELSEQQQLHCEEEVMPCEQITTSQSNNCKQETLAEARQHVESGGPDVTPPTQRADFSGGSYVISTSKESHSHQNR